MGKQNDNRRISRAVWDLDCSFIHNQRSYGCCIRNFSLTGLLIEARESVFP